MPITRQEVEHIARLARLDLTEAEITRFERQLSDILDYAARLGELDTRDIPSDPTTIPSPSDPAAIPGGGVPCQRLRPDEPGQPLSPEQLLKNAPCVQDGQFRTPTVMEDP